MLLFFPGVSILGVSARGARWPDSYDRDYLVEGGECVGWNEETKSKGRDKLEMSEQQKQREQEAERWAQARAKERRGRARLRF